MVLVVILVIILSAISCEANAQKQLSLDETISLARMQSVDAAVSLNELKTAYWEYRTHKADMLPEINFSGTLPSYNKSYSSYQESDGSYTFVPSNYLDLSGKLSVDQNIWLTGGKLSLTSSLDYLKQLSSGGTHQYMSVPVGLTLTQPIFNVNNLKWKRKIEPVRYAEAKAAYVASTEKVTMKAITDFFELILAKENLKIARQNLQNADKLYEIAKAKRTMGQISENEVLQLKLAALKAKGSVTDMESSLNAKMFQLRSFLGLSEQDKIEPEIPATVPVMHVDYQTVLDKAHENNSFAKNIRRRQLEADYNVASAKGALRSIDLYASVGYTGLNNSFKSSYQDLMNNQIVQVGVKIPLLDWGKRRGKVKVAESNRDVVESKIKQEQMDFNQDIFLLVEHFNNQAMQLNIAAEADDIAQQRYKTSIETFLIGKINTLDLNDAQTSKDDAKQKHISELYKYWYYYYQIRSLTLFDFQKNTTLDAEFDRIVKK